MVGYSNLAPQTSGCTAGIGTFFPGFRRTSISAVDRLLILLIATKVLTSLLLWSFTRGQDCK